MRGGKGWLSVVAEFSGAAGEAAEAEGGSGSRYLLLAVTELRMIFRQSSVPKALVYSSSEISMVRAMVWAR